MKLICTVIITLIKLVSPFLSIAETGHDPALHGSRMEDRFYNNDAFSVSNLIICLYMLLLADKYRKCHLRCKFVIFGSK